MRVKQKKSVPSWLALVLLIAVPAITFIFILDGHSSLQSRIEKTNDDIATMEAEWDKNNDVLKKYREQSKIGQVATPHNVDRTIDKIKDSVAEDAVRQYGIAKRNGDPVDVYVASSMVCAAYLQAGDETNYKKWKAIERQDYDTHMRYSIRNNNRQLSR